MEIFVIDMEYVNIFLPYTFPDIKIVSFSESVFPAHHELVWSQNPCIGKPDAILHLQTICKLNIVSQLGVGKVVEEESVVCHLDFLVDHIEDSLEQIGDAEKAAE